MPTEGRIAINLESLIDLSAKLNSTTDESFILNSTLLSLMGKLRLLRCCAMIPEQGQGVFNVVLTKGKDGFAQIELFEILEFRKLNADSPSEKQLLDKGFVYCLPLIYQNELLAVVCLGQPLVNTDFSDDEFHYAKLVSSISAIALQNARTNRTMVEAKNSLETRNQLLTTLFEVSADFSTLQSRSQILRMLSYRLMGQLMVSRFAAFFIDSSQNIHQLINRFDGEIQQLFVEELISASKIQLTANMEFSNETSEALEALGVRIISPMYVQGAVRGILLIGKRMNGENFTNENLQFIEALGNTAIAALENERLFQEELDKKQLEREMELALEIQKNLLPDDIPPIPGFDVAGKSIPARLVGGDYFDVIKLSENRYLFAIADVSGKGMPAALLMANVQAALRSLAPLDLPLKQLIERVNQIVYQNTSADKFVTFFGGILDCTSKEFHYINAGHNPPMLFRAASGAIEMLTEGGIILGITDAPFEYLSGNASFGKKDVLALFTDGITEAMNKNRKEFGEDRLKFEVSNCIESKSNDIISNIINAVTEHAGEAVQSDDITLLIIKSH